MARRGRNEGSVYKREDGRWAAALTVSGSPRKYFYGATRADVAEKLRAAQHAAAEGMPFASERLRLGDWLHHWLEVIARPGLRPRTYSSYEAIVRLHLCPRLGAVRTVRLTPEQVEQYLQAALASGLAPKTVRHHHAVLRRALGEAERRGLVHRNVARLVTPPRAVRYEVRPLAPSDAKAILVATSADRLAPLYAISLGVGLRQGEALGLRWGDVELETGLLSVRRSLQRIDGAYELVEPKTSRSRRSIALPDPLVSMLRQHRARQLEDRLAAGPAWEGDKWPDLVFRTRAGMPLSGIQVTRRFQRLLAKAGLPRMRFHDLRHGAATILLALGVDVRTIMETLGHSQISVTLDIYAGVIPELKRDAAARVGEALWGAS